MRLGEIRQKLDRVIAENKTIIIKSEPEYSGQAHRIDNYADIIIALESIVGQSWSGIDRGTLDEFQKVHPVAEHIILSQEEFTKLSNIINAVNQKLPIFYSILETIVELQDERVINIKLPSGINSIAELSKVNKKIENVLKLYNIDGQYDFQQFDRGTDWYVVIATGTLSYHFLIVGLDIAQKYFEVRKSYFESKNAELDYRAAVEKDTVTKQEVKDFIERKLKLLIQDEVAEAIRSIGIGENNENELNIKIVQATTALIKELDEGTEFHLSLNPPKYADETQGSLKIDYNQMKSLIATHDEEAKQLEGGNTAELGQGVEPGDEK